MATNDAPFTGSIIVDRPIMEVFEYASDPKYLGYWYPFYSRIDPLQTAPGSLLSYNIILQIGSLPWGPFQIDLVSLVPGRRLLYHCLRGGVILRVEFEPSSQGTIVHTSMSLWSWQAVLLAFTIPLSRPFFNDWISQSLASFKRNVEGRVAQNKPFVFFSYRREQAMYTGGRIYDALLQEFGEGFVFRDINSISGGSKWESSIRTALENCKVVIAYINDGWEDEIKKRINKTDVLREELIFSLLQEEKIFIPLFTSQKKEFGLNVRIDGINSTLNEIGGDSAHKVSNITKALKDRHGLLLRRDPDFQPDFQKLLKDLWTVVSKATTNPALKPQPHQVE